MVLGRCWGWPDLQGYVGDLIYVGGGCCGSGCNSCRRVAIVLMKLVVVVMDLAVIVIELTVIVIMELDVIVMELTVIVIMELAVIVVEVAGFVIEIAGHLDQHSLGVSKFFVYLTQRCA